jgi:hypothetical protein
MPDDASRNVAGGLRQRLSSLPKLSGSKFIKQAGSGSVRVVQRLSPENKRAFRIYHLEQVTEIGVGRTACPIHNHMLFHWLFWLFIGSRVR